MRAWSRSVPGTSDQVDQPGEGVLYVPAEHVEVGDQRLGVDVVRFGRGGRTGRGHVDTLRALQHLGHRETAGGLGVGGVGVDELLVLRHGGVEVTRGQRVLRGRVARVDVLLAVLGRRCSGPVASGWWRPVMPWVAICSSTWVSRVRRSSSGGASWSSGIIRPCTTSATSGTDGICSACASCGDASTSTLPSRKRPSNSSASVSRSVASRALSGACFGSRTTAAPARSSTTQGGPGCSARRASTT